MPRKIQIAVFTERDNCLSSWYLHLLKHPCKKKAIPIAAAEKTPKRCVKVKHAEIKINIVLFLNRIDSFFSQILMQK